MLGRVKFIFLFTEPVTSHEEVSWSLTLRQEIPNIHKLAVLTYCMRTHAFFFFVANAIVLSHVFRGHWSMDKDSPDR
jgi:hypothetical protein